MSDENSSSRVRIVLIGSGRMGQIRAQHLNANPRFDFCGIVDLDIEGARKLARTYHIPYFASLSDAIGYYKINSTTTAKNSELGSSLPPVLSSSLDEVASVASTDISSVTYGGTSLDAILISTPTCTHGALIEEAARYRLSIFTEKPVDETAEKISPLFEMCKAAQVTLACGFQRRFDPSYVQMKENIANNEIGKPLMANVFFGDHPCPPIEFLLKGGNLWMDLLCHDADFIRWCLDDEIDSVFATGMSSSDELKKHNIIDNGTVLLKFKKGAVVTVSMSRSAAYGYDQRCEIFGELGCVQVGNKHVTSTVLSNHSGIHNATYLPGFKSRFSEAFAAELDVFADVVLNGATWPITEKDCIAAQEIADAAHKSCESGSVVYLNK